MNAECPVLFTESQRLLPRLVVAVAVLLAGLILWAVIQQLVLGVPWGNNPASDLWLMVIAAVFGVGFPVFLVSIKLRTTVTVRSLTYQLWPLHLRPRRVAMSDIEAVEALEFRPIRDSGGWGIRFGRHGWYFTVSGNRGVLVKRRKGHNMVIGSKRPDELVAAILSAPGHS